MGSLTQTEHRIKSSLFRQPPLVSDTNDADPIFITIFSNSDRRSTSNPSGSLPTNSSHPSSDSSVSFRREHLGLYVQNYVPPPEPQYKGLQAAHKEPQPKPESKAVDWGAWDVPEPKPDDADENSESVLWGGAAVGGTSVKWAPTSGKGKRKKKNTSKGLTSQGHFLEPPVSRIEVQIQKKGVKWRVSPINDGSGAGFGDSMDCRTEFMPWDAPETNQGPNLIATGMAGVNYSSATGKSGRHQPISQPRSGFYFSESPYKPFVIEVSDDEDEESDKNDDENDDED